MYVCLKMHFYLWFVFIEHHVMRKALETCYYCLESPACLKHLLISVGSYVALSLPTYESLTEGHCILAPTQHIAALNLADEDVWQEITVSEKSRLFI